MIKDRNDKNFIPIAEEYIRKGLLDEAIGLLKEGIERYPAYLSARVSLGKAYLEKGMTGEAIQEFENVVRVSPDNLLAHRKLAVIYKDAGRIDAAIKSCEAVLVFNPKDREIADLLKTLKLERSEKSRQYVKYEEQRTQPSPAVEPETIDFTTGWEIAAEESGQGGVSAEFLTESMGDLYIAQGENEKGIEIYQKILQKEPENESVKGKLSSLKGTVHVKSVRERQIAGLGDFLNRVRTNRG